MSSPLAVPDLQYPIGKFQWSGSLSAAERQAAIESIESLPARFRALVAPLGESQLATPYRDGGWTVRQLAHHVPDSHMNAYIRLHLALTEDKPTIKPYLQSKWAELADYAAPVGLSLDLLTALHGRWILLWRSLTDADYDRQYVHPENGIMTIGQTLALYQWHGEHHLAHVKGLVERSGW